MKSLTFPLPSAKFAQNLKIVLSRTGIDLEEGALTSAEERLKDELMKKYTDVKWNIERKKYFKAV